MTNYEPGAVASATARGVPNVRVMRREGRDCYGWVAALATDHLTLLKDSEVTDIRPLVVIDAEDREQVERLTAAIAEHRAPGPNVHNIKAALRSLIHPPKPEEPTGAGAIITAQRPNTSEDLARLIRTDVRSPRRWVDPDGDYYAYAELDDVVVRHEGWGDV
jgi:hypothetical protein